MNICKKVKPILLKFILRSKGIDHYTNTGREINPFAEAIKVTVAYGALTMLWIIISDEVLGYLVKNVNTYKMISIYKGWVYIVFSMFVIYILIFNKIYLFKLALDRILRDIRRLNRTNDELMILKDKLKIQFSELQKQRDALIESENRYKLAVEGADCGIWDWDVISNSVYYSPKWKSYLGYEDDEIENSTEIWRKLIHFEDKEKAVAIVNDYINSKNEFYENLYRMMCKNGEIKYILSKGKGIRNQDGKVIRIAGSHTDITQQKLLKDKLDSLAYYDMLTGLPNSFFFQEKSEELINKNIPYGLLYIDIDNFKQINDTLGRLSGNMLLRLISDILKDQIVCPDFVCRLNGDEFAIIFENINDEKQIIEKIEDILKAIRKPWIIEKQEFFITYSIGIAISPSQGDNVSTLLQNADIAMHYIKRTSKDGYCFYSDELYEQNAKTIRIVNDLRRAVEKNELVLFYQPIFSIVTGKLIGVEALVRWNHPEKGIIPPMEFIPLAEEKGLIYDIEKWILRKAVLQKKMWEDCGYPHIKMSVNLSGKRVSNSELVKEIEQLILDTGIKCEEVQLEVTETAVMQDIEAAMKVLNDIKKFGIKIALDDFGSGYSSLTYLKKLPIDVVKLDREFIKNISEISENEFIVNHIIKLTHELKMQIVAEGIETPSQLIFLKHNCCDYGQGYLFSEPITDRELEELFFVD